MEFKSFSKKQLKVLTFWNPESPYKDYDAIICDGAVRSGKTVCMLISYVMWAMVSFNNQSFAICSKSISSLRRNILVALFDILECLGFDYDYKVSKNMIVIKQGKRKNSFYLFGGKDESSAHFIQGMTLAGALFDEVALLNKNFVLQAIARLSVSGSKMWFNCNPENPYHWFYKEWILKAKEKNALYLSFNMKDNPSLSKDIIKRYENLYSGVFYDRFILGKWVMPYGRVYDIFDSKKHVVDECPECEKYYISCDYGIVNPCSMGLFGVLDNKIYRIKEFYWDSKVTKIQKCDDEYYLDLLNLAKDKKIECVIIDPSASSLIAYIRKKGKFKVVPAKNDVIDGIRKTTDFLKNKRLFIHSSCKDSIREFYSYIWDEKYVTKDCPLKKNDHAMDEIRYFVMYFDSLDKYDNSFALCAERRI